FEYIASLEWVDAKENLLLVGPSGTGKSHALVGCGVRAVERGKKVRYLVAADLIETDRKSTRLNSSHVSISYAVFCLKKKMYLSDGSLGRAAVPSDASTSENDEVDLGDDEKFCNLGNGIRLAARNLSVEFVLARTGLV